MAELLINQYFTSTFVASLGEKLQEVKPDWDHQAFCEALYDKEWQDRALKQRMSHIARCLRVYLHRDYSESLTILKKICIHFTGLEGMVFSDFVQQFGQDHIDESLDALEIFTQYGSGEFAIRPFIISDEQKVMDKMLSWSLHENHHVRRLSSEGCRPRLPWAMALPKYKKDPGPILPILENLKDDPEEYVRKSVANNLNDLSKDNPETVIQTLTGWSRSKSNGTQWIIKHALRGMVKAGDKRALKILGFGEAKISLQKLTVTTPVVNFGEALQFKITLKNTGKSNAPVVVDYAIHFMKANGELAPKVFKIKNLTIAPGQVEEIIKSHPIKPITTRKYYPGMHKIAIQVNGKVLGDSSFKLIM